MKRKKCFTQESLYFMERILVNSGTGASPHTQGFDCKPPKPYT